MNDPLVLVTSDQGIVTLTLNNPASLNALSMAMLAALKAALIKVAADRKARVVILRGAGKAFCAGHDLKEMQAARSDPDKGQGFFTALFTACAEVMQMIPTLPQPVIAEVHGIATAAGCQLVAGCDMAIAAEEARFGVNGVNIGLFCSTPMVALTRNVPRKLAFEMLTTGQFISAARAADIGLVNRAVPADRLGDETMVLARLVASKLTAAVKTGKYTFYAQIAHDLPEAYALAGQVMVDNMLWRDTEEGISAFLEKRAPDWPQG
ncbi:MAG: enoyl-CoA hydratase [Rhodobacteraceae bacterium]|nr:enoyl-CoA hydratase [Paracoccaceae bacterium]